MSEKKQPVDLGLLEEDDEFEEFPAEGAGRGGDGTGRDGKGREAVVVVVPPVGRGLGRPGRPRRGRGARAPASGSGAAGLGRGLSAGPCLQSSPRGLHGGAIRLRMHRFGGTEAAFRCPAAPCPPSHPGQRCGAAAPSESRVGVGHERAACGQLGWFHGAGHTALEVLCHCARGLATSAGETCRTSALGVRIARERREEGRSGRWEKVGKGNNGL